MHYFACNITFNANKIDIFKSEPTLEKIIASMNQMHSFQRCFQQSNRNLTT